MPQSKLNQMNLNYSEVLGARAVELGVLSGVVVDVDQRDGFESVAVALVTRSEVYEDATLIVVESEEVRVALRGELGTIEEYVSFPETGSDDVFGERFVACLTMSELFANLTRYRSLRGVVLVFLHVEEDRWWASRDADMLVGDTCPDGVMDVRLMCGIRGNSCSSDQIEVETCEQLSELAGHGFLQSCCDGDSSRSDDITVEKYSTHFSDELAWLRAGELTYGYCCHGKVVVLKSGRQGEGAGPYSLWQLCTDPRANGAVICMQCDDVNGVYVADPAGADVAGVTGQPHVGAVHWLSMIPIEVRSGYFELYGPNITVRDLACVLRQAGAWNSVKFAEYVRCAHGVVVVSSDFCEDGTASLWSLAEDQDMSNAVVCAACTFGSSESTVSRARVVAEVEASVFGVHPNFVVGRPKHKGSRMCYADAFPDEGKLAAGVLGEGPTVLDVLALLRGCGVFSVLDRPVSISLSGGVAHVGFDKEGTVDVGDVVSRLVAMPEGTVVAGRCSLACVIPTQVEMCVHCVRRHSALTRLVDDMAAVCPCGELSPLGWSKSFDTPVGCTSDHMKLSCVEFSETVVAMSREPMEVGTVCRSYKMDANAVAQVRLHAQSDGGKGFSVEGAFVQVWIPAGVTVKVGKVEIRLRDSPMVLSAHGRVAAVIYGSDREYLVARSRDASGRMRWLHSVAGIDPADSTFSRFWSVVGGEVLALFSVGMLGRVRVTQLVEPDSLECAGGVSVATLSGNSSVLGGSDGTMFESVTADVRVANVMIRRGGELVFGPRVGSFKVRCDGRWKMHTGDDSYALDDGGPSDLEFISEF